jgi:hypothetical protein
MLNGGAVSIYLENDGEGLLVAIRTCNGIDFNKDRWTPPSTWRWLISGPSELLLLRVIFFYFATHHVNHLFSKAENIM